MISLYIVCPTPIPPDLYFPSSQQLCCLITVKVFADANVSVLCIKSTVNESHISLSISHAIPDNFLGNIAYKIRNNVMI